MGIFLRFPILGLVVLTALRDRLFAALGVVLAVAMGGAVLFGGAALVEQEETAVVLAAGAARLMTFILGVVEARSRFAVGGLGGEVMGWVVIAVGAIVPRLDLFAHSGWLVHGVSDSAPLLIAGAQLAVAAPSR